jgi:hypothetical protein
MSLKSLKIVQNASHDFKKVSISLKMPLKRIEIFTQASVSLKLSLICQESLKTKKVSHSQKKNPTFEGNKHVSS